MTLRQAVNTGKQKMQRPAIAYLQRACDSQRMSKLTLINFKAPDADAQRWREACKAQGVTVSEVCRQALEAVAQKSK
jgi:hypothetical protein